MSATLSGSSAPREALDLDALLKDLTVRESCTNMSDGSDYVHVMFATDENYVPYLGAVLASLEKHNIGKNVHVHIVYYSVNGDTLAIIRTFAESLFPKRVTFYNFSLASYQNLRTDDHITVAAYLRLFISEIIPIHIIRLIYLDCDLIVRTDIAELWKLPLKGKTLAAAPEIFSPESERLGFDSRDFYFNSGVLLIDLEKWRENGTTEKLIAFAENNSKILRYHDQDSLNSVLRHDVLRLAYEWNFQARTAENDLKLAGLASGSLKLARREAKIIHYTTGAKPWFYRSDSPFEQDYLVYARKTPWRHRLQTGKTPKARLRRFIKRHASPLVPVVKYVAGRLGAKPWVLRP